jgi:hypothetical protein
LEIAHDSLAELMQLFLIGSALVREVDVVEVECSEGLNVVDRLG